MLSKFLEKVKIYQSEIALIFAVVLISIISFQTGRFYNARQSENPIEIKEGGTATITNKKLVNTLNLQVVASKNSDKYHFVWCPGALKISETNKIYFASEEEAKSRGYILASNCKK